MSRSDIDAVNARFVQALEKGDAAGVAACYAPDAQVMPPGMPAVSGGAIRQLWEGVLAMGVTGGALKTVAYEEHDDVAIETGEYEMRVGSDVADNGSYVVVHRRQPDGSWKLGIDIWNTDRAQGPE